MANSDLNFVIRDSLSHPVMVWPARGGELVAIYGPDGEKLVTIAADFTTTVHDRARTDEAASAFWDAVIRMAPRVRT